MQVTLRPGQSIESAINKLKKKLEADGFHDTIQRHRFFLTKRQRRRLQDKKSKRKFQKDRMKNDNI